MFGRKVPSDPRGSHAAHPRPVSQSMIEALEDRRMLSASVPHHVAHPNAIHHAAVKRVNLKHAVTKVTKAVAAAITTAAASTSTSGSATSSGSTSSTNDTDGVADTGGSIVNTLQFGQAPTIVQSGLTTLAAADKLAAPTTTQTLYLGNRNGVESYTLDYTTSGTTTQITVDPAGNPVTAPAQSTTTWATLSGTGAGADAATTAEIGAIVTALGLVAPTSTTTVHVNTASNGTAVYTLELSPSSTSAMPRETRLSVDSSGNPVGDEIIPFSTLPTKIQTGLNGNAPTGATALATTSTQSVNVATENGTTFYSTQFTVSGTTSTVTVNAAGILASLPGTTTLSFSAIPLATQTELQTLATDEGVTSAISAAQSVTAYNEGNGTTIYSVTLSTTNGSAQTINVTVSADQAGNPTVPPRGGEGEGGGCGGASRGGDGGGNNGGGPDGDNVGDGGADSGFGTFRRRR
ncbi:MAG TPA: hypothetical protein VFC78_20240 [Tepidisphaeraceae bacterium]|nr:hypothetical protein [Tepidisphaeraceae bacterium]